MTRNSPETNGVRGAGGIDPERLAGVSLVLAGTALTTGITIAGTLYPDYSIHAQTISELGSTDASGQLVQPAATVFTLAMVIGGGLAVLAAVAGRSVLDRRVTAGLGVTGLGVFGVAAFPAHVGTPHVIAALVAFAGGGLTALIVAWTTSGAIRWLSAILGGTTLLALLAFPVLGGSTPLGIGGLERLVSLPIQCWTILFGGWLLGVDSSEGAP